MSLFVFRPLEEGLGIFRLLHEREEAALWKIEEHFGEPFDDTNTMGFKPASKLAADSLIRKIYNKSSHVHVGEIDMYALVAWKSLTTEEIL